MNLENQYMKTIKNNVIYKLEKSEQIPSSEKTKR